MNEQKPFEFKPWMWISLIVAALFLVFNFDPVGDGLEKIFGKGADKWAINITLIGMIIYFTFFGKKK
ncbi:MAG TPA: hypothetical protein PLV82_03400 [bacterium]|nr:hypothetical protein [bacterium]HPM10267.1 hypothetical protein [Paludibacter sp.]